MGLNISREGFSSTSLDSLFQGSAIILDSCVCRTGVVSLLCSLACDIQQLFQPLCTSPTDVPEGRGNPGGAEPAHRHQPPAPHCWPLLRECLSHQQANLDMAAHHPGLLMLLLLVLATLAFLPPAAAQSLPTALRAGHAATSLSAAAAAPHTR